MTETAVSSLPPGRTFHFISGLPRAGSTLTAAILRQNPRFHAGMSSPVASLFDNVIAQVSAGPSSPPWSTRRSARSLRQQRWRQQRVGQRDAAAPAFLPTTAASP